MNLKQYLFFTILCIIYMHTPSTAHNSAYKERQIAVLCALTKQVNCGQNINEALTIAQGLLATTDPDIQHYLYELNNAIAQWCIRVIEEIKEDD